MQPDINFLKTVSIMLWQERRDLFLGILRPMQFDLSRPVLGDSLSVLAIRAITLLLGAFTAGLIAIPIALVFASVDSAWLDILGALIILVTYSIFRYLTGRLPFFLWLRFRLPSSLMRRVYEPSKFDLLHEYILLEHIRSTHRRRFQYWLSLFFLFELSNVVFLAWLAITVLFSFPAVIARRLVAFFELRRRDDLGQAFDHFRW